MPTAEQRQLIFDKLKYIPSLPQAEFLGSNARIRLVTGGERSGKSDVSSKDFLSRFYEGRLYWLVGAEYGNVKPEFNYICEGFEKLGLSFYATKNVDPGEIIAEGGFHLVTKSAKDPRKLGMEAPDGIIVCEAAQIDYETYLRLRGRLAEKRAWMSMTGTLEGSLGWYVEMAAAGMVPENLLFRSFRMPTWSNLVVFPGGRQDPEILALEEGSSNDWFLERYGGEPTPPAGRVFTEFAYTTHVGNGGPYELEYEYPVLLWIDPGFAHAYAVEVVQIKDGEVYVIDEIYEKGLVTSDIIIACQQKPWWHKVIGGSVDIAARQHQAMPAVVEIWASEANIGLTSQSVAIRDGIEVLKTHLKVNPITNHPKIHINTRCRGLIAELGGALNPITNRPSVYKWRTDTEGNIIGDVPKDENCDAIKATIYGLVSEVGYTPAQQATAKVTYH